MSEIFVPQFCPVPFSSVNNLHILPPFFLSLYDQFLPHTGDRILITGAADAKVHVHDVNSKETLHVFSEHANRVKRVATAPMWPNTFWSAAEDGLIR